MLSVTAQSKVSQRFLAHELAKATALVELDLMQKVERGWEKKAGGHWFVDGNTFSCDCPSYATNMEKTTRLDDLGLAFRLATTPEEKHRLAKTYRLISEYPGVICKHTPAALHVAGMVDIYLELSTFSKQIQAEAKLYHDKELEAEKALLLANDPNAPITLAKDMPKRIPMPVSVLEVRGLVDLQTHVQWAIPLSRNARPKARELFLLDSNEDGEPDPDGTQLRAMEMFPEAHYKVGLVWVGFAAQQWYQPLPRVLPR